MALLAKNLYILVVVMSIASEIKTRILFRNASQSKLGSITRAGLIHNSLGVPDNPMRVMGCFAIVYVLDGGGRYKDAAGYQSIIKPGDLITLFPKLAHSYGPAKGEPWSEIWFTFRGPIFDLWEQTGILNSAQPIHHVEPIDYWFRRLEGCLGAPRQPNKFTSPLIEACRLQLVLSEMLLGVKNGGDPSQELAWASRACALLEADLRKDLDLDVLALKMGISYDHFRKRFTKTVGMPPAKYRSARIIDRACELIQGRSLTDKQIAETLGFCDEFHFSRRFKEITGKSPREFRKTVNPLYSLGTKH